MASGEHIRAETLKGYLLTEFIRQTHTDRARSIIDKDPILGPDRSNKIKFRSKDLTVELASICFSHGQDALKVLELDRNLMCGQDLYACLPLIAILLRLSDLIDFDGKRAPAVLFSHLSVVNPISLLEWQKHRSIENWDIHADSILFSAKCEHPAIEASIRSYCDYIDAELGACNNVITQLLEITKYKARGISFKLPLRVNREKIEPVQDVYGKSIYKYKDTKFNLSKQQVIDLLMGTQLYGNSEVALRELVQNSIDACLTRQALEQKWKNLYKPELTVSLYTEGGSKILEINDNGIGMDQDIIDNYYTKVGASFYKSADFNKLVFESGANFHPTSRFGIGVLSVFMVSDHLDVDTMKLYAPQKSSDPINLSVQGQNGIFWIKDGKRNSVGTITKLILKDNNPWNAISDEGFIESVVNMIPNPPFDILIKANSKGHLHNSNSFLSSSTITKRIENWIVPDDIRVISFNFRYNGLVGSCTLALLENDGSPVSTLSKSGKMVKVDDQDFPLSKLYENAENGIIIRSTTIGLDKVGEIKTELAYNETIRSSSSLSLHGIHVPTELFPPSWNQRPNQVKFSLPFPVILVVDVSSPRDLDLNSARSEILNTPKWIEFQERIIYIIAKYIRSQVSREYWDQLKQQVIFKIANSFVQRAFLSAENESKPEESIEFIELNVPTTTLSLEDMENVSPF